MAFNDSALVMPDNPNAALAEERTEWRIGELEIGDLERKREKVKIRRPFVSAQGEGVYSISTGSQRFNLLL
jgi:hypothetical protein